MGKSSAAAAASLSRTYGTPIGPPDTQIGAHALRLGITLVTTNSREFPRIKGLKVENWLLQPDQASSKVVNIGRKVLKWA